MLFERIPKDIEIQLQNTFQQSFSINSNHFILFLEIYPYLHRLIYEIKHSFYFFIQNKVGHHLLSVKLNKQ